MQGRRYIPETKAASIAFKRGKKLVDVTFMQAVFLLFMGGIAGVLNSIAGGGGILIFPSLMLAGLPSINANATGTIVSFPGWIAGTVACRQNLLTQQRLSWTLGGSSVLGGALGAILLLHIPTAIFDRLVPYILLISTLIFAFGDLIYPQNKINSMALTQDLWQFWFRLAIIQFVIAIYGGFSGLGITFVLLATLRLIGIQNVHKINALKMLLMTCIYSFAAITFVFAGVVAWPQALPAIAGNIAGSYLGSLYAQKLPPKWVKSFVTIVGLGMSCYFFLK